MNGGEKKVEKEERRKKKSFSVPTVWERKTPPVAPSLRRISPRCPAPRERSLLAGSLLVLFPSLYLSLSPSLPLLNSRRAGCMARPCSLHDTHCIGLRYCFFHFFDGAKIRLPLRPSRLVQPNKPMLVCSVRLRSFSGEGRGWLTVGNAVGSAQRTLHVVGGRMWRL